MSIDYTDEFGLEVSDRTWRVQTETPNGDASKYWIKWHREIVKTYPDGNEIPVSKAEVTRSASTILNDTIEISTGKTITAAEAQEIISKFGDKYRQEDLDNESSSTSSGI